MLSLEAFGQRIRTLRMERNLSQQQLAELIYVSRKTVGNWEAGNRLPDITMVSRLADCLGVEIYELIDKLNESETRACVIAVEESAAALREELRLLRDVLPNAEVSGFRKAEDALRFAKEKPVSAAFLNADTEGAFRLGEALLACRSRTNLIFISANDEHAAEAMRIHASGYLHRPLSREAIRREVNELRRPVRGLV